MTKTIVSHEIDHEGAEAAIQTFSFKAPETYDRRKAIVRLTLKERGETAVHYLGQGGENNLNTTLAWTSPGWCSRCVPASTVPRI